MDYNYSGHTSFQYQPNFSQTKLFMKQKLFGAAAMVAFILFGASCAKQEQSEFNLNSVTQEVMISSRVTYDAGVEVDASNPSGYKRVNAKPAVGRKVFIEIPYSEFTNPGAAAPSAALKIFETVTDEDGVFTITIPTRSEGINATIRLEEFTAIYNEYVKMENGKPVFKSKMYSYETPAGLAGLNLKPGAFKFPSNEDIAYAKQELDMDAFEESVTLAGTINLAYETGFRKGAFKSANNATVELSIIYDFGTPDQMELKFGTTTDAQGNYSITLPVKSLADGFRISALKVLGIGDNQFIHYDSDSTSMKVYGAYELVNFGNIPLGGSRPFQDIIEGVTYNLGAQNLLFTPYYNDGVTNAATAKPDNWDDNLIGWAAGMAGFDESYSKIATITGRVFMPYLTAFGEGAYRTENQTIVLTAAAPYDNGLTVITDANGNFSVDIPVKDDNAIAFNVKLAEEVQPFTYIDSKSKSIVLREGKYDDKIQIKKEDAQWYELGDFYFKYSPKGTEKPAEWDAYNIATLIGWYKSAEFTKPVQVTGSILFAVETQFGTGEYQAQTRLVTVHDATNNRDFTIKTKANGSYDFMIPLKDENDKPNIAITSDEYDTNEFVHYPKYNSSESKLLSGTYTIYKTVYDNKEDKEAWNNLGTQYMYINTTDLAHPTSTYSDNLAGWYIKEDNDVVYKNSATASGKAYLAVETGFLKGEYVAAKGMLITLTVYTEDIKVLSKNSGSFTFNVPIKNVGDETTINVAAAGTPVEDFKHYKHDGKIQILDGEYNGDPIKEDGAEWNELGNVYYKFTPKTPAQAELWTTYAQHIAGWAYKKGYNLTQTVSGQVKLAVEGAELEPGVTPELQDLFRMGHYTTYANIPVKIVVNGITYVAPTQSDGTYAIDVVMQFADDTYGVDWKSLDFNPKDLGLTFEHYRNPGSDAKMTVEGNYTEKATKNASTKWYEQGTRYYEFDPDDTPKNWTSQINGWDVWEPDQTKALSIQGAIKIGEEDWFSSESEANIKWSNAAYALATVTVDGHIYKVATNSAGRFSVKIFVKDAPEKVKLTIAPEDIPSTQFKHWGDYSKNSYSIITGKFQSKNNVNLREVERASATSTTYDLTKNPLGAPYSAKMTFSYDGSTPDNWAHYEWDSNLDKEKNKTE